MADGSGGIQPVNVRPVPAKESTGIGAAITKRLLGSKKRGGRIKKTGPYELHKGEVVVPAGKAKRMKMRGGRRKSR